MGTIVKKGTVAAAWILGLALAAAPVAAPAMEHGGMAGMQHGGGSAPAHDMMKMGDKLYEGKLGPWTAKARLIDMKAQMAAMPGMKSDAPMPNSHHVAMSLADGKTKAAVAEGSGTITVTGPGGKAVKVPFMAMQGHFGADVNLPGPGKYTFKVEIASGKGKGSASFAWTVK
jgi:hypothetical protein